MLKIILIVVAVVIVGILIFAATKPDVFTVTRSATIAAPPAVVFDQVNDLHKWQEWSPWAKLDPNAKESFEGPESGAGAKFSWNGNKEVGEGNMAITKSEPTSQIDIRLEFIKPFAGVNDVVFGFKPEGSGTVVTWTMSGQSPYMMKVMSVFMNCDKMCGDMFEKGLAKLNTVSQAAAK